MLRSPGEIRTLTPLQAAGSKPAGSTVPPIVRILVYILGLEPRSDGVLETPAYANSARRTYGAAYWTRTSVICFAGRRVNLSANATYLVAPVGLEPTTPPSD